jgi:DivIVA domain-containing protein
MPLTPNEISNKKFPVVHRRGYDRPEVDRFLAFVAEHYSTAIQKIAIAAEGRLTTEDDIASEIAELLRAARTTTTRIKEKAQAEADRMRSQAEADVREQREAAEAEVRARLDEAEKERDDVLQRAAAQATRTIEVSEQQRSKVAALLEERYGELLEHERELRTRIASLEKLVAEMRGQLEPLEQIDLTEVDKLFAGTKVNDEGIPESQFAESSRLDIVDLQRRVRETEGHEKNALP